MAGRSGGDEDGGGVEQDDVAAGAGFAGEDGGEDGALVWASPPLEGLDGGAGEADFFGGDGAEGDDAVVDFGDSGWGRRWRIRPCRAVAGLLVGCWLVSPWTTKAWRVPRRAMASATRGTRCGGVDAHDLRGGSGGVGERADEMEDGADAEGSADGHDGLHGRVEAGGVEEGEAMRAEGGGAFGGREADGDAEGFEDVGGTGLAR